VPIFTFFKELSGNISSKKDANWEAPQNESVAPPKPARVKPRPVRKVSVGRM
jgi:hypothetical protein